MQHTTRIRSVRRSQTLAIAISVGLNFTGFTLIDPIVPFLIGQYANPTQLAFFVGALISVYALCEFVAAPILGACSDRFGRRPVLLLSLVGSAVGYLLLGGGGSLWLLFAGRMIDGLTAGNVSAMYAYVADVNAPAERGRIYGLLGAAGGFGFIVGPVIGGLLGQISIRLPLFFAAGLTVLNIAWVYFRLPESLPTHQQSAPLQWAQLNPIKQLSFVFSFEKLRRALAVSFLFFFAGAMLQANIAVLLKEQMNFSPLYIGMVLCAVGAVDVISQGVLTPKLLPFMQDRKLAAYGLLINACGFALFAALILHPSIVLLGLAVVVFTLGDGLFQPAMSSVIAASAPGHAQGRVQGANQAQQAIARALAPLIGASLYGAAMSAPYLLGSLLTIGGATLLWVRGKPYTNKAE